jgi:hypothetical protein
MSDPVNEVEAQEIAAVACADNWLALVDDGNYQESWQQAAQFFKDAVPEDQWEPMARAAREQLGKLFKRTLKFKQYATSLPGAPPGEYVVIQYLTIFENEPLVGELITPMKDKDGHWRVSGYFIK